MATSVCATARLVLRSPLAHRSLATATSVAEIKKQQQQQQQQQGLKKKVPKVKKAVSVRAQRIGGGASQRPPPAAGAPAVHVRLPAARGARTRTMHEPRAI
jgi:hypothetical protein